MSGSDRVEVVVLGAGPGGYAAAFRAADLGKTVALVEPHATLGGVCLNVGCIPSKALLHAAAVVDEAAAMANHGIRFGAAEIDLDKLRAWKDSIIGRLTKGLDQLAGQRQVERVRGRARFVSPQEIAIEGGDGERRIVFESAIVAVGARAIRLPDLPEDPRIMDSTGALELSDVPERLLVIGGGVIGLELAGVYDALGAKVIVVELLDKLMAGADADLVRPLQRRLAKRYEAIHLGTRVVRIEARKDDLRVGFEGPRGTGEQLFDRVLVAVGRRPNGDRIDAGAAGIRVDERGFLPVDQQMRTNVPHIFAIGDVSGRPMLAHKATHEGKVAAEAGTGMNAAFDARAIPSVAYTNPEVAWVGLAQEEATAQKVDHEVTSFPWAASGRALALGRPEGLTKLVLEKTTGRVLGMGAVGVHAGDLVGEAALAIEMGCDAADLALTIHAHPTLSETLGFVAEIYEGTITDL